MRKTKKPAIASFKDIPPDLVEAFLEAAIQNFEKYQGQTIVLKFGGEMLNNDEMLDDILRQALKLKRHSCNVILVHGGGPQISEALKDKEIVPEFDKDGKRICNDEVLEVSYETLRKLNKDVVVKLNQKSSELGLNILAMGEAGYNGGIVRAQPLGDSRTGIFESIDKDFFKDFARKNRIPVIYTICMGPNGEPLNVNADDVAAAIAKECGAKSLIMVTDVAGVWDENKEVVPELTISQARRLIETGAVEGGMKPKVEAAISVAEKGISVVITTPKDGGLFRELFTAEGSGTMFHGANPDSPKPVPYIDPKLALA